MKIIFFLEALTGIIMRLTFIPGSKDGSSGRAVKNLWEVMDIGA
jgi:hypothetical protein